jgi:hypothetical protein
MIWLGCLNTNESLAGHTLNVAIVSDPPARIWLGDCYTYDTQTMLNISKNKRHCCVWKMSLKPECQCTFCPHRTAVAVAEYCLIRMERQRIHANPLVESKTKGIAIYVFFIGRNTSFQRSLASPIPYVRLKSAILASSPPAMPSSCAIIFSRPKAFPTA